MGGKKILEEVTLVKIMSSGLASIMLPLTEFLSIKEGGYRTFAAEQLIMANGPIIMCADQICPLKLV